MFEKLKERWNKFLKIIADQNKVTYGEGGLKCCELKDATIKKD